MELSEQTENCLHPPKNKGRGAVRSCKKHHSARASSCSVPAPLCRRFWSQRPDSSDYNLLVGLTK
jgi:hypothetical protein